MKEKKSSMVQRSSPAGLITDAVLIIVSIIIMFCCVIPLWHVLMASLSDPKKLLAHNGVAWLPVGAFNLEGYKLALSGANIVNGYMNTIFYVVGSTVVGMFINITGGYVLSRKTKIRAVLILMVMFTMLFNGGLIPTYMIIQNLGWVGTRWALLIPGATNAFFVVMMMNAFSGVPESTVEAARIDGAGHLQTMFMVMLPQCKSMTTVVIINSIITQWNSWFPASIYITNKRELWPLQLWIRQLTADNATLLQNATPDYNRYLIQYAVIIAATLPILVSFPFFQKTLEKGMISGGVKG